MTDTSNTFMTAMQQVWDLIVTAARQAGKAIANASWGALLVAAVALALFITILPLVIFLFVTAVVVKYCMNHYTSKRERGPSTPYKDVDLHKD